MKGEGVWPVCFDGPYWQKQALQTYKHVDTESDKKNVGAKGNCVQYTFGVDWDFRLVVGTAVLHPFLCAN